MATSVVHTPPRRTGVAAALLAGASRGDQIFRILLTACAIAIPVLLFLLLLVLVDGSQPAIHKFGLHFIVDSVWDPVAGVFGAFPLIIGTLLTSTLALVVAVPLSLGVAIYLTEFAPTPIRKPVAMTIELLAAIPSVVYGLWGIFVLVPVLRHSVFPLLRSVFGFLPFFQGVIYGPSVLAASVILAIMVMPFIMSVAREVLLAVPNSQREAAMGLGATRWEAVRTAILPYARSGIMGAIILGLGRALGETMAVTMLIGNRHDISMSLFAPGYTMAAVIANEFAEASSRLHFAAMTYVALVLFLLTVLINAGARLLIWRVSRGAGPAGEGPVNRRSFRRFKSNFMVVLMVGAVILAVLPLFFILASLVLKGASSLSLAFFTRMPVPAGETGGGVLHAILGTLLIVGAAALIGVPVGMGAGLFCAEYPGSRLAWTTRFVSDVMNGTPSIVIGVFAYTLVVAPEHHYSGFAGSVALAILMIPMIMRSTEELIKLVPNSLREAALALGYARWRTSLTIILRTALPGIVTGSLLAIARVAGETAPLLLTALGSQYLSFDLNAPMAALPLLVYKYATGPYDEWHQFAWASALVLILVVLVLSIAARIVTRQRFGSSRG